MAKPKGPLQNPKEATRSGRFVKQLKGYVAFQPAPLPPEPPIVQDEELTYLLGQATYAVGKLSGLAAIIADPDLFVLLVCQKGSSTQLVDRGHPVLSRRYLES